MKARADANAALVRRMMECFNSRQFDRAAELFTPDFFSHPLGATGFEAGKNAWRLLVARFPDMRIVVEDVLVDGDKVAVRSTIEGMAPSGTARPMMIEIFRIDSGRLAENWALSEGAQKSALGLGSQDLGLG
jgi:predicted SnoaL-like aldol condensation-catalyzing enzyme